jgi:hypothetical protein
MAKALGGDPGPLNGFDTANVPGVDKAVFQPQ